MVMPTNAAENPYVFESEVLSPFAQLKPGQSYTWRYDWYACNIGGDFPVVDCSDAGVVAEPLSAEWSSGQARFKGRFGVFAPGTVRAEFADARGRRLQTLDLPLTVSPLKPVVLDTAVAAPANAASVKLVLIGADGKAVGRTGQSRIAQDRMPRPAGQRKRPGNGTARSRGWSVSTTSRPPPSTRPRCGRPTRSIRRPSTRNWPWPKQAGFNCARVFLQYLVWENDPNGLEKRLEQFLSIAKKHGIRTLFVLFDECAFSTMTEPFLGKQPDVIPGEYANGWTPSPGPKRVLDRAAWPKLEAYVRAVVGRFRDDPRVLGWDVYNEPSNTGMGNKSLPLAASRLRLGAAGQTVAAADRRRLGRHAGIHARLPGTVRRDFVPQLRQGAGTGTQDRGTSAPASPDPLHRVAESSAGLGGGNVPARAGAAARGRLPLGPGERQDADAIPVGFQGRRAGAESLAARHLPQRPHALRREGTGALQGNHSPRGIERRRAPQASGPPPKRGRGTASSRGWSAAISCPARPSTTWRCGRRKLSTPRPSTANSAGRRNSASTRCASS